MCHGRFIPSSDVQAGLGSLFIVGVRLSGARRLVARKQPCGTLPVVDMLRTMRAMRRDPTRNDAVRNLSLLDDKLHTLPYYAD